MRILMDEYNKLLNEKDYTYNKKSVITESSLSVVYRDLIKHDCALLSAFRGKLINCLIGDKNEDPINIYDNKGRNKQLKSVLLALGYGVTAVKGSFIENFGTTDAVLSKEDTFFIVNLEDKPSFIENIIELSKLYCQDSVLISEKGGDNIYLYGTNHHNVPGLDKITKLSSVKFGKLAQIHTRVKGRPFTMEDVDRSENFKQLQNNTKMLVSRQAKPVLELLKK
jgi:hypothetical protein